MACAPKPWIARPPSSLLIHLKTRVTTHTKQSGSAKLSTSGFLRNMKIVNQAKYYTLDIFLARSSVAVAGSLLDYLSISPQVIYKKFQIACPFEEFSVNSTANLLSLNISSAHSHDSHEYTNGVAHEDDDSHCATHLFTINSQVGSCHWQTLALLILLLFSMQVESGVSTLGFSMTVNKSSHFSVSLADRVHYSHPCFRLCVPP